MNCNKRRERRRPANHPFSQSADWFAKGAAQRGRTEGAVLPVRRSAPEHDPYMTSEHSTTARWIRRGVNFEEGGNRSARRKPSKSGWDRLKLNPHTTLVVEVEGVNDVRYASLTSSLNGEGKWKMWWKMKNVMDSRQRFEQAVQTGFQKAEVKNR